MKKIFIADPALKSHHGHHHAITERFSESFNDLDVEIVWLVNKAYSITAFDKAANYKVDLAFSEDTYDAYKKVSGRESSSARQTIAQKIISLELESGVVLGIKKILVRAPGPVRQIARVIYRILKGRPVNMNDPHPNVSDAGNYYESAQTGVVKKESEKLRPEQEIYRALTRHGFTPDDCVIFHTCDAHTYRDVLSVFVTILTLSQWNNLPVFLLSTPYDMQIMPHNNSGVRADNSVLHMNSMGLIETRIFLFAENELLATQLTKDWGVSVSELYIPFVGSKELPGNMDGSGKVVFTYLGAARTEKGFPVIAEVVAEVLKKSGRQDILFTIQISPQIMGYTADVKKAVGMLLKIDDSRLQLIKDVQSPEDYSNTLQMADVLFLAYEKTRYAARSSGIAIEALENGKNVIATAGTFPAYITGDAGVQVSSKVDIVNAIDSIVQNIDEYQSAAHKRREWIMNKCSVDRVHDVLDLGQEIMVFDIDRHFANDNQKDMNVLKWRPLL